MLLNMLKDKLTITKVDGTIYKTNFGSIQKEHIIVMDAKIPIECGDIISRTLPSGIVEQYSVIEPGFHSEYGSIQGHYQITYERYNPNKLENEKSNPTVVNYHITGNNQKVNIHSIDKSTTNQTTLNTVFENLKQTIEENLKDAPDYEALRKIVLEMEQESGKKSFIEKYQDFMSLASNHISVFAPLLPALSKLLS